MVLEATIIVIDNSEFTRNGDYVTNRYEAQLDTVEMIFQAKTNSNPENTVGIIAYGGEGPHVLSTLTNDFGKILSGIHDTKIDGSLHFSTGIQVAALALKHRQNKLQHQRIVAFVGSPIEENEKELDKLAKKMKKNNIAIDFVNYGEESVNTSKLEKFVSIVNSHDNSHLVTVPPSNKLLYEAISSSPIVVDEDGPSFANARFGSDAAGDGLDFGDPSMDPDLALALRLSLEEEQARQTREEEARHAAAQHQGQLDSINEQPSEETAAGNNDNEGDTEMGDSK